MGAAILGDPTAVKEGDRVTATGRIMEVPVGEGLIGRVVDPLGRPLDGKGPADAQGRRPVEKIAPNVVARQSVSTPVQTGIKAVDAMIPIGRGQRELIIGDRSTGKSAIALGHYYQPSWRRPDLYLCRNRSKAGQSGPGGGQPGREQCHGAYHCGERRRLRFGSSPIHRNLTPAAPWRKSSWSRVRTSSSFTTTLPSMPGPTVKCHCCSDAPPGARLILETSFTCIASCWKERPGWTRSTVGVHHSLADYRDPGWRRFSLHPHQRNLHYRRANIPGARPVQCRYPSRGKRRAVSLPGWWVRPDSSNPPGGG